MFNVKHPYIVIENPTVGAGQIKGWMVRTKTFVNGKIIVGFDKTKKLAMIDFLSKLPK